MISVKNPTPCTMLLVILCYASLAYSQHPATSNATTAAAAVNANAAGARTPAQQDKKTEAEKNPRPLISAIAEGDIAPLAAYKANGGDVNKRLSTGSTLFSLACRYNKRNVMQWLVDNGAKFNGSHYLTAAIKSSSPEAIQYLLELGVTIHRDALLEARDTKPSDDNLAVTRHLLSHGADPNECSHSKDRRSENTLNNYIFRGGCCGQESAAPLHYVITSLAQDQKDLPIENIVKKAKMLIGWKAFTGNRWKSFSEAFDILSGRALVKEYDTHKPIRPITHHVIAEFFPKQTEALTTIHTYIANFTQISILEINKMLTVYLGKEDTARQGKENSVAIVEGYYQDEYFLTIRAYTIDPDTVPGLKWLYNDEKKLWKFKGDYRPPTGEDVEKARLKFYS